MVDPNVFFTRKKTWLNAKETNSTFCFLDVSVAVASDPTTYSKYHSGFSECATEVSRYLTTVDGIDTDLKTRLLNHLANCVTSLDNSPVSARATPPATAHVRPIQMNPQRNAISPPLTVGNIKSVASVPVMTLPEINNNVIPAMHGLTVAGNNFTTSHSAPMLSNGGEDRLRNTDLAAFVIPGNVLSGAQLPGYIIPLYSGNASKLVQQDASDKDSSTLNLPTVVPVPIQLQQASPRAFTPDSSNIDSDKGMDLTLDSRQRKDARDAEVENRHHKEADEDVKPDIAEPASRNPNPAAEGPMWRPWWFSTRWLRLLQQNCT